MDRNLIAIGCALCFTTCGLASVAQAAEQAPTVFEDVGALKLQAVDDTVLASQDAALRQLQAADNAPSSIPMDARRAAHGRPA